MRTRLFHTYLVLIVVSVILTGIISLKFNEKHNLKIIELQLVDNAKILRDYVVKPSDVQSYDDIAKEYGAEHGMRLTIIALDGTVTGDSFADISLMDKHDKRPEVKAALKGEIGKSTRYSNTLDTQMMYIAIPINEDGVIRIAMPLTIVQENTRAQWRNIFFTLIIALAIAVIQGERFSRNVTKPILGMVDLSQKIANGEFTKRIEINTKDEMEQLAEAFNTMASRLEFTMGELKDNNLKLQTILSSMIDGIIAVDLNLDIMLINPTAMRLFKLDGEVLGKYFLEVIRNSQMEKMIQQVIYQNNVTSFEMNVVNSQLLRINGVPMKGDNEIIGALILVQDITELRRLEQVRSDFVANVSHELKTPLTSIKGFVETLKDGAIKDKDTTNRFLDIINIEAERLSRLINDILCLSELEAKKSNIVSERINIAALTKETNEIMKSYAKSKGISIGYLFSNQSIWIQGNKDRLKQMIINLVDNAIKYTPSGGSVTVLIEDLPDRVVLRVRDTGIGISKEHIPRLFERFYRVDKGRSRSLGGTGLGLAIVKHIVLSMRGEIIVSSEVDKGTEFTINLPKVTG